MSEITSQDVGYECDCGVDFEGYPVAFELASAFLNTGCLVPPYYEIPSSRSDPLRMRASPSIANDNETSTSQLRGEVR